MNSRESQSMEKEPARGTFEVIYADPPWGLHQQRSPNSKGYAAATDHYSVMSDDRILGLGRAVRDIAADNSFCFIWVTAATVPLGIKVLDAWGYRYANFYFWAKPRFTLGNTFRNAGELLLLGLRGKGTKVAFKSQPNWGFHALQEHSRKPEELHMVVERLVGANERTNMLELFARRPAPSRLNWKIWGDEVPADEPSLISLAKWGYLVPGDHHSTERTAPPESHEEGDHHHQPTEDDQ